MEMSALDRARRVRLLTCDVDGVLTDGKIYVNEHGGETKAFSVLDGLGLKLLVRAGIAVAWITGSNAPAVEHRARMLGVEHVLLDAGDKLASWTALCRELAIPDAECAHIGDDLPDLPILRVCGFAVAVPHAPALVREHAHYVTDRDGGSGAVRELAELILAAQGKEIAALQWRDLPPRAA